MLGEADRSAQEGEFAGQEVDQQPLESGGEGGRW